MSSSKTDELPGPSSGPQVSLAFRILRSPDFHSVMLGFVLLVVGHIRRRGEVLDQRDIFSVLGFVLVISGVGLSVLGRAWRRIFPAKVRPKLVATSGQKVGRFMLSVLRSLIILGVSYPVYCFYLGSNPLPSYVVPADVKAHFQKPMQALRIMAPDKLSFDPDSLMWTGQHLTEQERALFRQWPHLAVAKINGSVVYRREGEPKHLKVTYHAVNPPCDVADFCLGKATLHDHTQRWYIQLTEDTLLRDGQTVPCQLLVDKRAYPPAMDTPDKEQESSGE